MAKIAIDGSIGAAVLLWLAICLVSGESMWSCVFLLGVIFWGLPRVWSSIVSQTFDNQVDRLLMFGAVTFFLLAVYSLL